MCLIRKHSLLFLLPLLASCATVRFATVSKVAKTVTLPSGAPRYSDVCFSSRWERPRDGQDSLETFSAARSFHATYFNWVYTTNPSFIHKADSLGYKLQSTLSPSLSDLPFGSTSHNVGRMVNKAGHSVTAPWMKTWENWWGCVNNPAFQALYFSYIQAALDAGAYGFQVDDPAMGYLLLRNKWEDLCYCEFCRRKADSLHLSPPEIQEASVLEFHQMMKRRAEAYKGRTVPFSCNNFEGDWELFPFDFFDFGIAEIPERRANPEYLYATMRETRRQGKAQVFTFVSDRDWLSQKMIAAAYATGSNLLVPWDVWRGADKPRYFGKPETYASLYGFVRAMAPWLDGYEDAFYANSQDDTRFQDTDALPVSFVDYRRQAHAFVRAKPSQPDAPVVIHLIDWHVLMEPFGIKLNERRFFKKGITSIELLTPALYDVEQQELAEQSGDFSKLVVSQKLTFNKERHLLRLDIPKLEQHWGVLVIR